MKVVVKLKSPVITNDGLEKTKAVIVNDELRVPLANLLEFDSKILEPLPITEAQSTFFSTRGRTFFVVSYLPRSVVQFACECCGAEHFAFIEHNKDLTPDGEVKKAHFHILLHYEQLETMSRVIYWFRSYECRLVSTDNISKEWNYLTHNSEQCRKEHKVPYADSEITSNSRDYWLGRCYGEQSDNVALSLYEDFILGLPPRELIKRYGFRAMSYFKVMSDMANYESFSERKKTKDIAMVVDGCIFTNNSELEKIL